MSRLGTFVDSRRISVYTDSRGRTAALYVVKTIRRRLGARTDEMHLCSFLVREDGGAGGGCSPTSLFLNETRHVSAGSGRLFAGVVANAVHRVVIVGSRGKRHPLTVSPDGGFIYNCRAYNGCANLIACVEAYDAAGKLLSKQAWMSEGCARRTGG